MLKSITLMILWQRPTKPVLFVNYASIYEEDFDRICFQLYVSYTQLFQLHPSVRAVEFECFYLVIYFLFIFLAAIWFIY